MAAITADQLGKIMAAGLQTDEGKAALGTAMEGAIMHTFREGLCIDNGGQTVMIKSGDSGKRIKELETQLDKHQCLWRPTVPKLVYGAAGIVLGAVAVETAHRYGWLGNSESSETVDHKEDAYGNVVGL